MRKFCRTPRRWRGSFLDEPKAIEPQPPTVDLGSIAAKVHGGCMGLPQELVECIVNILQADLGALKACSLTCKSIFASTRHLIHRTLCVTKEANRRIFTPAEEKQYAQGDRSGLGLRFLSFMAEHDLLKYARHLNICMGSKFSPYMIEPHLQHFQSLDRIDTLTIDSYNPVRWCAAYDTYFTQFHPTLTTLILRFPAGHHRCVLQFALQFPNLQNLTLDTVWFQTWVWSGISVPPLVSQSPPLRGHFRCLGLKQTDATWLREFAFGLPNGINFRSIELRDIYWKEGQQILDGCVNTVEEFTMHIIDDGFLDLGQLQFQEHRSLRSIVFRIPFAGLPTLSIDLFYISLSTITSLAFSELVIELGVPPTGLTQPSLTLWGNWEGVDELFEGFLSCRPDFKLVIRPGRLYNRDEFQAQAKERFPLMARRGCIQFETSLPVDK